MYDAPPSSKLNVNQSLNRVFFFDKFLLRKRLSTFNFNIGSNFFSVNQADLELLFQY